MAVDFDRSNRQDKGISFGDLVGVFGGSDAPATADLSGAWPNGSVYLRTSGQVYKKQSNAWTELAGGGASTGPMSHIDLSTTVNESLATTGVWVDQSFDVQRNAPDSEFSHSTTVNNEEITINESAHYLVLATLTTELTAGTARSESHMRIVYDDNQGGGYAEVAGTHVGMYNRTTAQGVGNGSATFMLHMAPVGSKIKVQAQRTSGTSTMQTHADGCTLTIIKMTGVAGADGADGADGATGATGPAGADGADGGGANSLNDLTDVDVVTTTPATNDILKFDGTNFVPAANSASVSWGGITGTLSAQTDLNSALNGKAATGHTHTASNITDFNTSVDGRVTYEALNANGDVGTGATQVAKGDHEHAMSSLNFIRAAISAQSGSSTIPNDDTRPTSSEGTSIFSQSITLSMASHEVHINVSVQSEAEDSSGDYGRLGIAVFRDSTCIGGSMASYNIKDPGEGFGPLACNIVDAPGDTNSHTYSVRVGSLDTGTWYIGRTKTARWGGALSDGSYVTLLEVMP